MPTTLVLVRHGETDWNADNRFQGHADPPLNETGRAQARALATELRREVFAALYTSPLQRAAETAAIIGYELGLEPRPNDALKEVDVGSWSGLTRAEVEQRYPTGFARWLEFGHGWDDGETYDELGARVVTGLTRIGERHDGGGGWQSRMAVRSAPRSRSQSACRSTRRVAQFTSSATARS